MKVKSTAIVMAIVFMLASCTSSGPVTWETDFDAAKTTAEAKKKQMFVFFSGMEWDGVSQNLKSTIFDSEVFLKAMGKKYVLINIDFPADEKTQDAAILEKKYALAQTYNLQGAPAIMLMNAKGEIFANIPYDETVTTPEQYLESVKKVESTEKERADIRKKISKAKGIEKVKLIDQLYEKTDKEYRTNLMDLMKEVPELDPNNETGLLGKYKMQLAYPMVMEAFATGNMGEGAKIFFDLAASGILDNAQKQEALYMAAYMTAMSSTEAEKDKSKEELIISTLQQAYDADPTSLAAESIKQTITQLTEAMKNDAEAGAKK